MKKRFLSLMLVLAMMVGVFTPLIANAADAKKDETTESVTLHKMLMSKENLNIIGKKVTVNTANEEEKENKETKLVTEKKENVLKKLMEFTSLLNTIVGITLENLLLSKKKQEKIQYMVQ